MWDLYDELIDAVPSDIRVKDFMIGLHWTVVRSEQGIGVAKTVRGGTADSELGDIKEMSLKQLAFAVKSWNMLDASLGLAAINSILNTLSNVMEISAPLTGCDDNQHRIEDLSAFTHHILEGTSQKIACFGHFPKIEYLRKVCQLTILDRNPQPGDYPDSACEYLLPEQDLVYITGTAFINKTLPRLLELSRNAQVVLLGPSVPISPVLFKHGADLIAGMVVSDQQILWEAVQAGGNNIIYDKGGQRVCISR
jgi:uncharacterized protein (DUF4213/DUF364 family)